MGIANWTTPTIVLTFTDETLDLTQAANVYVTLRSGTNYVTKTGTALTITAKTISIYLSQVEVGSFGVGGIEIQANWTDSSGNRFASDIATITITGNLLNRVIS